MLINAELEELVKSYQDTNLPDYLNKIVEKYKGTIRKKAHNIAASFGLLAEDCESVLYEALWQAAEKWDRNNEKGIPFRVYVNLRFKHALGNLFRTSGARRNNDLLSTLAERDYELADPRDYMESIVEGNAAAEDLLNYIKAHEELAALATTLRACNCELTRIAELLGCQNSEKKAKKNWTAYRLRQARKLAIAYYLEILKLDKLPMGIKLE